MNPYQKLIERKRKWTPVEMEAGKLMEGSEKLSDELLLSVSWSCLWVTSSRTA